MNVTIKGLTFPVADRYAEGHTLTAAEAAVLNQTFCENLRNNFTPKVEKFKKDQGIADAALLSEDQITQLTTQFDAYASEYEFAGRRIVGPRLDPVTSEANKIAWSLISEKMREKGKDPKALTKEQRAAVVAQVIAGNPQITATARARVEAVKSLAIEGLGEAA